MKTEIRVDKYDVFMNFSDRKIKAANSFGGSSIEGMRKENERLTGSRRKIRLPESIVARDTENISGR